MQSSDHIAKYSRAEQIVPKLTLMKTPQTSIVLRESGSAWRRESINDYIDIYLQAHLHCIQIYVMLTNCTIGITNTVEVRVD